MKTNGNNLDELDRLLACIYDTKTEMLALQEAIRYTQIKKHKAVKRAEEQKVYNACYGQ